MPYDHPEQRYRIVFAEPDALAGLIVVVRAATVDDYVRIGDLTAEDVSPAQVAALCDAMGPMLVEWDLTVGGEPVAATTAGLRSLDARLASRLARAWLDAIATVPVPLETPSSDGDSFPEASLPMEPRSASPES